MCYNAYNTVRTGRPILINVNQTASVLRIGRGGAPIVPLRSNKQVAVVNRLVVTVNTTNPQTPISGCRYVTVNGCRNNAAIVLRLNVVYVVGAGEELSNGAAVILKALIASAEDVELVVKANNLSVSQSAVVDKRRISNLVQLIRRASASG